VTARRLLPVLALLAALLLAASPPAGAAQSTTPQGAKERAAAKQRAAVRKRAAKARRACGRRRTAKARRACRKRVAARQRCARSKKAAAKCRRATANGKTRTRRPAKAPTARRPVAPAPAPASAPAPAPAAPPRVEGGADDVTVVAVLDTGMNPYHRDFLASALPQHTDGVAGNDLPLDRPATEWLAGFPQFATFDRLDLKLSQDPKAKATALQKADAKAWADAPVSTPDKLRPVWLPGTKVIGALNFRDTTPMWGGISAHGVGTTSSAVGNVHGTCPECLLFFVQTGDTPAESEAAIDWVMRQPWIDAISNSYGYSLAYRDRIYSGSDVELQRAASDRGQTIFFSAGNGQANAFTVPNTTSFSSQEGPDWIVTVGAVAPGEDNHYFENSSGAHAAYLGAGKPADVAGIGSDYPTAYGADEIGATGETGFSGTSNATPQIAGLYARALSAARTRLAGPSRAQDGGVIATGAPVGCAAARPDCELGDGRLTVSELRTRLLHGAVHPGAGTTTLAGGELPPQGEEEYLNKGHGAYFGRESKDRGAWLAEFDRIVAPLEGRAKPLPRPEGEREWMIVDSYCRQQAWGDWTGGYYVEGRTELPESSPGWPIRSAYAETCPGGPVTP
jgi:hypothetical protein